MSSLIKSATVKQEASINLGGTQITSPSPIIKNEESQQKALAEELSRLKQKAIEDGYRDGKKTALDELEKLANQLQQKQNTLEASTKELIKAHERDLLTTVTELKKHQNKLESIFEERLLTLTLACIYKLAGNKDIHKDIVEQSVKLCLKQSSYKEKVYIRLPEASAEYLGALADTLKENCIFVFEKNLAPGKCLVNSTYSTEDLSMETQLEQLKEQLFSIWDVKKSNA